MKSTILIIFAMIVETGLFIYSSVWFAWIPPAKEAVAGIEIKADIGEDYWQVPAETRRLKTGDCEDFAYLIAEKYNAEGIPFSICAIDGITQLHIVLKVGGYYVDSLRPKLIFITRFNQPKYTWTYAQFKRIKR